MSKLRPLTPIIITVGFLSACEKGTPKAEPTAATAPSTPPPAPAPKPEPAPVKAAPKAEPSPSSNTPRCDDVDDDCGAIAAIVASASDHFASLQCTRPSGTTVTRVSVPTVGSCRDASTSEEWVFTCTRDLKKELPFGDIIDLREKLTPCFTKAGWKDWRDKTGKTTCTLDNAWVVRVDKEPILELRCFQAKEKDAGVAAAASASAVSSGSASASAPPAAPSTSAPPHPATSGS